MYRALLVLCCSSFCVSASAQTAEDSVKNTITQFFAAMKSADAPSMRKIFADSAILQTISFSNEGKTIIRNEPVPEFIDYVGKQKAGVADERISFEMVKTDGPLAIAWTPYKFYFNGEFHHCGINSFQLVKVDGEWRIQYIIDTRRKEACE